MSSQVQPVEAPTYRSKRAHGGGGIGGPGGGRGGAGGPEDQTPRLPAHPGELGTGLVLLKSGAEKIILDDVTHDAMLSYGTGLDAIAVKWVSPSLATGAQVHAKPCATRQIPCTDTCIDVCICDPELRVCV